jgi:hypothetical protein
MSSENTGNDTEVNNPNKTPMKEGYTGRPDDAPASDVKSRAAEKDGLVANSTGLSFTSVNTGKGKVMSANVPDQSTSDALADALQSRWDSGYGQISPIKTPMGDIQTPIGAILNGLGSLGNKNIQSQLRGGGIPVYGRGDTISIGYDPNADIKDLKGVMGTGLFGGTAYSGQGNFNPNQFDNKGNRLPPQDNGGDDNQTSTLGNAVAAKPIIKKKPTEFSKANNVNPQQQNVKVRKPKAAGDGEGVDGALVRRTKTLQSNRRGILGRPDSKKKTLLGA